MTSSSKNTSQPLVAPTTDRELKEKLDYFFEKTKSELSDESELWKTKGFQSLIEIAESKPVITKAIEKLKRNDGSMTPGVDNKTIKDFLKLNYDELVEFVRSSLKNYKPQPVWRVWIDKPGKKEKRPLGIPTIGDRIVQECIRIVIEPILEAQFWKHSYGFRPFRNTQQAYARITDVIWKTGNFWVVEGDISKFFDNVNHTILLKKLYAMGIRDRRVLMIIKQMLKSGIMGEVKKNDLGTPQGGIISPLLANVYLHSLDKWITREWEEKHIQHPWNRKNPYELIRKQTNLKPAYFVRYADDWVLITDTKKNAEKWKWKISQFLKSHLKLELSDEKTLITNVTQKAMKFTGFEIKYRKKYETKELKAKGFKTGLHGYVTQSKPDQKRLEEKLKNLTKTIKRIRKRRKKSEAIHMINVVNSTIIGLHNYYNVTTLVNPIMSRYSKRIWFTARRSTFKLGNLSIAANKTDNLTMKHEGYTAQVVAVKHQGQVIGITGLNFVKTAINSQADKFKFLKDDEETPYSKLGRKLYYDRTGKRPMADREDEVLSLDLSLSIMKGTAHKRYNVEFECNRGRAFNIAKGKCQCCKRIVGKTLAFHTHHKQPHLPIIEVNKTNKLAIVCVNCHQLIHNDLPIEDPKVYNWTNKTGFNKIVKLRKMLIPKKKSRKNNRAS
ncbi:group II intron reverse transcriptase/maturase [Priestia megaterium]|uniref:Group II intron reverse transcriptase/maturase n=1 Tax=Priestia megaterium TaxID=1404 RepID=A0A6M6E0K6_PRIMG|nr:group II intron reverse transcriptase/maturase [Priestia megaterium]QJX80623.1 group II intron reverse transcriptase/maturase [Priestia megaterium]